MSDRCILANIEKGVCEIETSGISMFQISLKEKKIKGDEEDVNQIITQSIL